MRVNMKILAERIKLLREQRGLLQKTVASDLSIGNTTLSNYEKNISSPNPEMLVTLADYFGTSTDYLLGRTDDPSPDNYSFDEKDKRFVYIYNALDKSSRNSVADYAAYILQKQNGKRSKH